MNLLASFYHLYILGGYVVVLSVLSADLIECKSGFDRCRPLIRIGFDPLKTATGLLCFGAINFLFVVSVLIPLNSTSFVHLFLSGKQNCAHEKENYDGMLFNKTIRNDVLRHIIGEQFPWASPFSSSAFFRSVGPTQNCWYSAHKSIFEQNRIYTMKPHYRRNFSLSLSKEFLITSN